MQIREKGKKLLCIRTEYNPEKKRTFGKTVASQDKYMSTVSEEVCRQLSEEEVDQLEKWLSDREEKRSVDMLKTSLSTFKYSARRTADALSVDEIKEGLSSEEADEIWLALDKVSKALRKAGFKKPKPEPKAQPRAKSESQPDLYKKPAEPNSV